MPMSLRIDFVSDVSCPWCVVGLKSLQRAVANLGEQIEVELHFQPFELHPEMSAGGEDATTYLVEKFGINAAQLIQNQKILRERGAEVGFTFNQRNRIYNTFDAHRLLHWAGEMGHVQQLALKEALLHAHFTDNLDISSHEVLVALAQQAGLDIVRARHVLVSDEFVAQVRAQERSWLERGINGVPAIIINGHYMLQGGQPIEVFEKALRQVVAERSAG